MEKTPNSNKPGPRKIEVYGSLQGKALLVGLTLILTLLFGPLKLALALVIFVVATVFVGGGAFEGTLWDWLLIFLLCVFAIPLYHRWSKLARQLKELRDQMD